MFLSPVLECAGVPWYGNQANHLVRGENAVQEWRPSEVAEADFELDLFAEQHLHGCVCSSCWPRHLLNFLSFLSSTGLLQAIGGVVAAVAAHREGPGRPERLAQGLRCQRGACPPGLDSRKAAREASVRACSPVQKNPSSTCTTRPEKHGPNARVTQQTNMDLKACHGS